MTYCACARDRLWESGSRLR